VGVCKPAKILSIVLLPAPFLPTSAMRSRLLTTKLTSENRARAENSTLRCSTEIIFIAGHPRPLRYTNHWLPLSRLKKVRSSIRGSRSAERQATSAEALQDSLCEGTTLFWDSVQNKLRPASSRLKQRTTESLSSLLHINIRRIPSLTTKNKRLTTKL